MAIASIFKITNDMPIVIVITVLSAVLLLRGGQRAKIKGDAAVAMISVGALAVGYLLLNLFAPSGNLAGDVCSTLFGSTIVGIEIVTFACCFVIGSVGMKKAA